MINKIIKTMKKMYKTPQTKNKDLQVSQNVMLLASGTGPEPKLAPGRIYSPAPSLENL